MRNSWMTGSITCFNLLVNSFYVILPFGMYCQLKIIKESLDQKDRGLSFLTCHLIVTIIMRALRRVSLSASLSTPTE